MAELTVIQPARVAIGRTVLGHLHDLGNQPAVRRALPLLALAMLALAALALWNALSAAPQRVLFPGLGEGDKAAVAAALDTGGIAYAIDRGTGALSVGGDDYHRARMALAAQGLPKDATTASSDTAMPMGASEAVERDHLQGSREADLARTIETIDAVATARVHLAVEAPSLFVRERKAPRASVMLTLHGGRTLGDAQVAGIANLVAASVSGLAASDVAIIDQRGALLSSPDGASAALAGQLGVQKRIEDRYREAVATVLTPLVGRDGFTAEVHADLDFGSTDATRENYPESARALRAEDQKWTRDGTSPPPAVGIPGTLSNTPPIATTLSTTPPPATAIAAAGQGTTSQDVSRRFELGREVSVTRGASGTVRRLSLAVALRELPGKRRSGAELQALEALVRGAVGADAARGDVVAVSARPFVVETAPDAAWWQNEWIAPATRFGGLAVAAGLFWLLVGRKLLGRYEAQTAALRRGETAGMLTSELGTAGAAPVTLDMIEAAPGYTDRAALVRDYVRQDPARAADVLRTMLKGADRG